MLINDNNYLHCFSCKYHHSEESSPCAGEKISSGIDVIQHDIRHCIPNVSQTCHQFGKLIRNHQYTRSYYIHDCVLIPRDPSVDRPYPSIAMSTNEGK